MPTDLTGTPTSLGIGTYNVDADEPSGLGFNEAMQQIDALLVARTVAITSVFGRTGAVIAEPGDYSAAEVTGAADKTSASAQVFAGDLESTNSSTGGGSTQLPGWHLDSTNGVLYLTVAGLSSPAISLGAHVASGAQLLTIDGDGSLNWSNGTGTVDTILKRLSAGVLNVAQGNLQGGTGSTGGGSTESPGWTLDSTNGTLFLTGGVDGTHYALVIGGHHVSGSYLAVIDAAGNLRFGTGTGAANLDTTVGRTAAGVFAMSQGNGIGYATGVGGTGSTTQASGSVSISKPCGQITVTSLSLAAGASCTITLNNTLVATSDIIVASVEGADAGALQAVGHVSASGVAKITLTNISGASVTSNAVINFALIKGATS